MNEQRLYGLRALEGHHVGMTLVDGSRIDDWELVAVGAATPDLAWIWDTRNLHAFVPLADVAEYWEMPA